MDFLVKFHSNNRLEVVSEGKTTGPLTLGETFEQIAEYYYTQKLRYQTKELPRDEPR